jgi:hypothetical protein
MSNDNFKVVNGGTTIEKPNACNAWFNSQYEPVMWNAIALLRQEWVDEYQLNSCLGLRRSKIEEIRLSWCAAKIYRHSLMRGS